MRSKPAVRDLYSYLFAYKIPKLAGKYFRNEVLPEYATPYSRRAFNEIIQKHTYDYIIISYAYWANFVKNAAAGKAKLIIDTHDFLTSQEHGRRGIDPGLLFGSEISRLSLFHEVWTVSVEEQYLFRQFCNGIVRLIPVFLPLAPVSTAQNQIDVVYVAGDNPHNRAAAAWFFSDVWPQLGPGVTLTVVGRITGHIRIAFNGKAQSSFIGWNAQPATVPVYVYRPEAIFVVSLSGVTKVVFDALFMR